MRGEAVISECGKYRYVLRRPLGSALRWYKPCLFTMLNPSTADASIDDPTIRRCMEFAKREGRTHLTVVNKFAYRATDPSELNKVDNPFGPLNGKHLCEQFEAHKGELIIAAWGANQSAERIILPALPDETDLFCLGLNKNGSPKHPLYLRSDAPLIKMASRC